ncbi:MAG: UPF0104 family protein [Bacteroidetes bacterium CHB6]|nr:UPF0104 family protein [Bacteroidetes bacterium CHB6]
MKGKIISAIKYLLFLALGVGMLWLTFRNQDFSSLEEKIKTIKINWLIAATIAAIISHLSRAARWAMLIEPLGYKPKLSNTFWALCVGYLANLAVPRIGEITRCGVLTKAEKVPFNELIGTVIVERIIDVIMLFILLVAVAAMQYHLIGEFLHQNIVQPLAGKFQNPVVLLVLAAGLVMMIVAVYFLFFRKREKSNPLLEKITTLLKGVVDGIKSISKLKNIPLFIFHTVFIWAMYFLATWFCFFTLDATSHLSAVAGLFILVAGGLGMSAPVQGGIGAFHYIVSRGLMLYGISETDGIIYATISHGYQTLLLIVLGTIGFFVLMATSRKSKTDGL